MVLRSLATPEPPVVGSIATASSLTAALVVVVVAAAVLAASARFVPEASGG